MDSILTSIKKLLGPSAVYDNFDTDLIIHINSTLAVLTQLGLGPPNGYTITSSYNTWNDFIPDEERNELVKTYVYLKAKLVFDPPTNSAVLESMEKQITEFEWRLQVSADSAQKT